MIAYDYDGSSGISSLSSNICFAVVTECRLYTLSSVFARGGVLPAALFSCRVYLTPWLLILWRQGGGGEGATAFVRPRRSLSHLKSHVSPVPVDCFVVSRFLPTEETLRICFLCRSSLAGYETIFCLAFLSSRILVESNAPTRRVLWSTEQGYEI